MAEQQWGTVCLPFELQSSDAVQYYSIESINTEEGTVTLKTKETVAANEPAVFILANPANDTFSATSSNIVFKAAGAETMTKSIGEGGDWKFIGTAQSTKLSNYDPETYAERYFFYLGKENFRQVDYNGALVPAFRAYINYSGNEYYGSNMLALLGDKPEVEEVSGDVDGNGKLDLNDDKVATDIYLGNDTETDPASADMNDDGKVTMLDVNIIMNMILSK